MSRGHLWIVAGLCMTAGCKKEENQAPAAKTEPTAEVKKAEAKPPACPPYHYEGKDLCTVTYKSLKDVAVDGGSAAGKRGQFPCSYHGVSMGEIECWGGGQVVKAKFNDDLKPKIKALRNRQQVVLDAVIVNVGPMIDAVAFSIDSPQAKRTTP